MSNTKYAPYMAEAEERAKKYEDIQQFGPTIDEFVKNNWNKKEDTILENYKKILKNILENYKKILKDITTGGIKRDDKTMPFKHSGANAGESGHPIGYTALNIAIILHHNANCDRDKIITPMEFALLPSLPTGLLTITLHCYRNGDNWLVALTKGFSCYVYGKLVAYAIIHGGDIDERLPVFAVILFLAITGSAFILSRGPDRQNVFSTLTF